jgi:predicted PhzF superfamily epimerase YddE/YHI9
LYGIPEESATGTSNGALACYLHKYGILTGIQEETAFEQGIYMNRPSMIKAKLTIENGKLQEIWVGGEAVIFGENSYLI